MGHGGVRHDRAGDRAARGAARRWWTPACSTGPGVADRMSAGPAVIGRLAGHGRHAGRRPAGQPDPVRRRRPRDAVDPATHASRSRNTPFAGHGAARPGGGHVPARPPDRARREAGLMAAGPRDRASTAQPGAGPARMLVLEDGTTFHGTGFGADGETFGEMVFNTGMTGYQETLTDPSYCRQIVAMTAPHIGNTGVNDEDPESRRIWVQRVRGPRARPDRVELAGPAQPGRRNCGPRASPAIAITGTRALTRHLRDRGAMRAGISTDAGGPGRAAGPGAGQPADDRRRPGPRGVHRRAVHGAPAGRHPGPLPGRRGGPGHQDHDPAVHGPARLRGHRAARH